MCFGQAAAYSGHFSRDLAATLATASHADSPLTVPLKPSLWRDTLDEPCFDGSCELQGTLDLHFQADRS
jgi:hypothetical protein